MQSNDKFFSNEENNFNENDSNNDYNNDYNNNYNVTRYTQHYSDDSFFLKLTRHYKKIGRTLLNIVITLFYTLRDSDTPKWAKTIVLGALGYFILPVDIIPDFIPITGFTDDFGMILIAFGAVGLHIKDKHKENAKSIIRKFF